MIPAQVAIALRADGWYLRSDIIWNKPNPMPESVTDRCTKSHEYIFMLTKSERYYYDAEAIKEPATWAEDRPSGMERNGEQYRDKVKGKYGENKKYGGGGSSFVGHSGNYKADGTPISDGFRNKRDVWTVATQPCAEAHFATFPPKLIEPMILAGTKEGDTILDPFMGSGTTAIQAVRLHRHYLGCELNPEYVTMAERRIADMVGPLFVVTPEVKHGERISGCGELRHERNHLC
jgi:DNA modification methylase